MADFEISVGANLQEFESKISKIPETIRRILAAKGKMLAMPISQQDLDNLKQFVGMLDDTAKKSKQVAKSQDDASKAVKSATTTRFTNIEAIKSEEGAMGKLGMAYDSAKKSGVKFTDIQEKITYQSGKGLRITRIHRAELGRFGRTLDVLKDAWHKSGVESRKAAARMREFNKDFVQGMARAAKWVIVWSALYTAFRTFTSAIGGAIKFIIEMNKEQAQLARILNVTGDRMAAARTLMTDLEKIARAYGETLGKVVAVARDFALQGRKVYEIIELTKATLLGATLGFADASQVARFLTATLNAFNIRAESSVAVIDSVNAVTKKFSISFIEMAQAMRTSAVAAQAAEASLFELEGIVSAIAEATRKSGSEIGTALRSIFVFYTRPETVRGIADLTARFGQQRVQIAGLKGEVKSFLDVMGELRLLTEKMTEEEKKRLAQLLGSTRRQVDLLAVLERYPTVISAITVALQSEGSTTEDLNMIMQTLWKRSQLVREEFEKQILDIQDKLVPVFRFLIDSVRETVKVLFDTKFAWVVVGGAMLLAAKTVIMLIAKLKALNTTLVVTLGLTRAVTMTSFIAGLTALIAILGSVAFTMGIVRAATKDMDDEIQEASDQLNEHLTELLQTAETSKRNAEALDALAKAYENYENSIAAAAKEGQKATTAEEGQLQIREKTRKFFEEHGRQLESSVDLELLRQKMLAKSKKAEEDFQKAIEDGITRGKLTVEANEEIIEQQKVRIEKEEELLKKIALSGPYMHQLRHINNLKEELKAWEDRNEKLIEDTDNLQRRLDDFRSGKLIDALGAINQRLSDIRLKFYQNKDAIEGFYQSIGATGSIEEAQEHLKNAERALRDLWQEIGKNPKLILDLGTQELIEVFTTARDEALTTLRALKDPFDSLNRSIKAAHDEYETLIDDMTRAEILKHERDIMAARILQENEYLAIMKDLVFIQDKLTAAQDRYTQAYSRTVALQEEQRPDMTQAEILDLTNRTRIALQEESVARQEVQTLINEEAEALRNKTRYEYDTQKLIRDSIADLRMRAIIGSLDLDNVREEHIIQAQINEILNRQVLTQEDLFEIENLRLDLILRQRAEVKALSAELQSAVSNFFTELTRLEPGGFREAVANMMNQIMGTIYNRLMEAEVERLFGSWFDEISGAVIREQKAIRDAHVDGAILAADKLARSVEQGGLVAAEKIRTAMEQALTTAAGGSGVAQTISNAHTQGALNFDATLRPKWYEYGQMFAQGFAASIGIGTVPETPSTDVAMGMLPSEKGEVSVKELEEGEGGIEKILSQDLLVQQNMALDIAAIRSSSEELAGLDAVRADAIEDSNKTVEGMKEELEGGNEESNEWFGKIDKKWATGVAILAAIQAWSDPDRRATAILSGVGAIVGSIWGMPGVGAAIGGAIGSLLDKPGGTRDIQKAVHQNATKIDVTNKQLEIVNRNLVAMRRIMEPYPYPRSYYFRQRPGMGVNVQNLTVNVKNAGEAGDAVISVANAVALGRNRGTQ